MLIGWCIGETIQAGIVGAFMGAALGGTRLRILFLRVLLLGLILLALVVALQTTGLVPIPVVTQSPTG